MVFGISSDALIISAAIIAVGLPVVFMIRSQNSKFVQTKNSLEELTTFQKKVVLGLIDEKMAMMNSYTIEVKLWKQTGLDISRKMDKIIADITATVRMKHYMTDDQKIKFNEALRHLTKELSDNEYDTGRIEDVSKLIS